MYELVQRLLLSELPSLCRPWAQGGLACPDLQKYFLAALLMHAHNWVTSDDINASVVLEAAYSGSYEFLRFLPYCGLQAPFRLTISTKVVL